MSHYIIKAVEVHATELANVNLTCDLSTTLELLMLVKAHATQEFFGTNVALF
jgi:hypothetical protein